MKPKFKKEFFWKVLLGLIGAFFIFGGRGLKTTLIIYLGVFMAGVVLLLAFLNEKKIVFPKGSFSYLLLLIFFLVGLPWHANRGASFNYFLLFLSGGLFWLAFFNLKDKFKKDFNKLIIFLGLIFGIMFFINKLLGINPVRSGTLYTLSSNYKNHNHIGDLWTLILLAATYFLIKGKKKLSLLLIPLAIYFLAISLSRSAYASLALGAVYLFTKEGWLAKHKKALWLIIATFAGLFVFAGGHKTTLYARPYFVQGVIGFLKNPLGVGMGNFSVISSDPKNHLWGMDGFSSMTHNLIVEILAGMGIFGISFLVWLFIVIKDIFKSKKNILYKTIFIALGVNFLFDTTYFIPTMLWLWFISLGLAMDKKKVVSK